MLLKGAKIVDYINCIHGIIRNVKKIHIIFFDVLMPKNRLK